MIESNINITELQNTLPVVNKPKFFSAQLSVGVDADADADDDTNADADPDPDAEPDADSDAADDDKAQTRMCWSLL